MARCQRYYLAYGGEFASQALASGGFISTTGFLGYCAFPTTMRAAATISFSGSLDVRSSSSFNVTAIAGSGGATSAAINATVSGATVNDAGVLRCNNVNNGQLLFSAEL